MGLLDYYRQFEGMSEAEVSRELRERAARERAHALTRVETLDLSTTLSPELPHSEIVNAITYPARGWGLNRYPDRHATELRRALAGMHGVEPAQVAVGDGASQLLISAIGALLGADDELVTFWPSYPLFPLMARRARGRPVAVDGFSPDALLAAVTDRTRVLTLCNPNDPTGDHLDTEALGTLLARLPDHVTVLLDEALVDYVEVEPPGTSLRLLEAFPRLIVFRTLSKAWGLAGMRCGYALGGPGSEPLLERLVPPLGLSALTQAGALEALRRCPPAVERRRRAVLAERRRLLDALADLPVDAAPSQANFLWLSTPRMTGVELASELERRSILVQAGQALGDERHVRATVRDERAGTRLLEALRSALA